MWTTSFPPSTASVKVFEFMTESAQPPPPSEATTTVKMTRLRNARASRLPKPGPEEEASGSMRMGGTIDEYA